MDKPDCGVWIQGSMELPLMLHSASHPAPLGRTKTPDATDGHCTCCAEGTGEQQGLLPAHQHQL